MRHPTKVTHKTVQVGDRDVFYRESGPRDAPALLLLHGFPTSSRMFRNLIPVLADEYRVLAPDYPGFGHSSMPLRRRKSRAAFAEPYRRDLKTLEFHLLYAGHFALETNGAEIATLMCDFLARYKNEPRPRRVAV